MSTPKSLPHVPKIEVLFRDISEEDWSQEQRPFYMKRLTNLLQSAKSLSQEDFKSMCERIIMNNNGGVMDQDRIIDHYMTELKKRLDRKGLNFLRNLAKTLQIQFQSDVTEENLKDQIISASARGIKDSANKRMQNNCGQKRKADAATNKEKSCKKTKDNDAEKYVKLQGAEVDVRQQVMGKDLIKKICKKLDVVEDPIAKRKELLNNLSVFELSLQKQIAKDSLLILGHGNLAKIKNINLLSIEAHCNALASLLCKCNGKTFERPKEKEISKYIESSGYNKIWEEAKNQVKNTTDIEVVKAVWVRTYKEFKETIEGHFLNIAQLYNRIKDKPEEQEWADIDDKVKKITLMAAALGCTIKLFIDRVKMLQKIEKYC